jgi:hypothetical protein
VREALTRRAVKLISRRIRSRPQLVVGKTSMSSMIKEIPSLKKLELKTPQTCRSRRNRLQLMASMETSK